MENQNAQNQNAQNETLTLPSGAVATFEKFKGRHVRQAQSRVSANESDAGSITFVIISMLVKINDKPIVIEDLDEMPGEDVLALMTKFSAANFRQ